MDNSLTSIVIYGLFWVSFGVGHSLLAGATGRSWLQGFAGRRARLVYNFIYLAHLMVVLGAGLILFRHDAAFRFSFALRVLMDVTVLLGFIILYRAGRAYDLGRFLGLTDPATIEPLFTGGMNAIVRHPLYLGLILTLSGLSTSPLHLTTTIFAIIYILIGIGFEERKLHELYGLAYRDYCNTVPKLIPRWPLARRVS